MIPFSVWKTMLRRAFTRPQFYLAVTLVTGLYLLLSFTRPNAAFTSVVETLSVVQSATFSFIVAYCIAPLFAFSSVYAEDQTQGMMPFWTIRCSSNGYAVAQFVVSVVGGFLAVLMGGGLFVLLTSLYRPFVFGAGENFANGFLENPTGENIFCYFLVVLTASALSGALICAVGAWVGSLIPDKLVVFSAPVLIYMFSMHIPFPSFWPECLNPVCLQKIFDTADGLWYPNYLLKWAVVTGLCIILGFFTQQNIVRRQRN